MTVYRKKLSKWLNMKRTLSVEGMVIQIMNSDGTMLMNDGDGGNEHELGDGG